MPRDLGEEARARLRRTDPAASLDASPLAPPTPAAPDVEAPGHAGPLAHLRARDPRARLDAAAMQLHGGRAGPGTSPGEHELPEAPPRRSRRGAP